MGTEPLERKLAGILYADVAGYSRLTGEDEDATHRRLSEYLDRIAETITQHHGEVMHYAGDAVLAKFDTVVDALSSAAAIQTDLRTRNQALPDERKVQFRIGVNMGDVIIDRGDIYGDGVNVAARLESLAEPAGICISESVRSAIGKKLPLEYEFLGEQQIKNITEPVKAYHARLKSGAVLPAPTARPRRPTRHLIAASAAATVLIIGVGVVTWGQPWRTSEEPASVERVAFPLPDKPSIAVLPFANMSGDPEQDYFVDGMTDDLITDLSKMSGLFVIARNSSFAYKGKSPDVRQVSRELGVKYVLEGSVRRAGEQVRINAQLIDSTTGGHLWADRYDGRIDDVFALQDKVTAKIVTSLALQLTAAERQRVARPETDNVVAYDAFLQGWEHLRRQTADEFAKALPYLKKAVELDSNYGRAYAALAWLYYHASKRSWHKSLGLSHRWKAAEQADRYLTKAMKHPTSLAHQVAADKLWQIHHKFDEAVAEAERAIALDPGDPVSHAGMARALIHAGRAEEAIDSITRAMRLDPHYPPYYLFILGLAHFTAGQLEKAANVLERALERNPEFALPAAPLAAAYAYLGREQEARAALDKFTKAFPGTSVQYLAAFWPFKESSDSDRFFDGLRKAGLPDLLAVPYP